MYNYFSFVDYSNIFKQYFLSTQCVPEPTYTVVREKIFSASHYTRIWIPSLNKDNGVDIHKQFSGTMVLSYEGFTATRITHNAFVLYNKEGKEWCYPILLAPKTSLACNKLFLQQRKRGLCII